VALNDVKLTTRAPSWSPAGAVSEPHSVRPLRLGAFVAMAIVVDALLVIGSFTLAYASSFVLARGLGSALVPDFTVGKVVLAAVAVGLLASHNFYDLEHPQPWPSQLYTILSSISIALAIGIGLSVVLGETFYARTWFAGGWAAAIAAVAIWHAGLGRGYTAFISATTPARRAIVVGANIAGQESARELEDRGYQVVGYADNGSDLLDAIDRPLLGPIARLDELVQSFAVDELVIALPPDRRAQLSNVLTRGFGRFVQVKYAADFGDLLPRRFNVRQIGARQYIDFAPVARVSWMKRAIDLILGLAGLVALLPLLAVLALAIKLESPGPVLYGHLRIGKDGRHFRMLKFRSMQQDADDILLQLLQRNEISGPMFKIRRDPRVTRVGRILRRYSLDELPQLLNVLRGEMSLVGPRPPLPAELERYEDWQFGRLRALPGITGLWQVSGRTEVPFHDMVRLDLHYIRNWSLALDLEILLRTVPAVFTAKGAY